MHPMLETPDMVEMSEAFAVRRCLATTCLQVPNDEAYPLSWSEDLLPS